MQAFADELSRCWFRSYGSSFFSHKKMKMGQTRALTANLSFSQTICLLGQRKRKRKDLRVNYKNVSVDRFNYGKNPSL